MGNRNQTGTVKRTVNQLKSRGLAQARTNLTRLDRVIQRFLTVVSYKTNQAVLNALGKGYVLCAVKDIGLLDLCVNNRRCVVCHLAAVRTVCLITIILCRIVGRRHHNTRVALIVTGRKGKRRNRHQRVINPHLDPVCRKHARRCLGEYVAL